MEAVPRVSMDNVELSVLDSYLDGFRESFKPFYLPLDNNLIEVTFSCVFAKFVKFTCTLTIGIVYDNVVIVTCNNYIRLKLFNNIDGRMGFSP